MQKYIAKFENGDQKEFFSETDMGAKHITTRFLFCRAGDVTLLKIKNNRKYKVAKKIYWKEENAKFGWRPWINV